MSCLDYTAKNKRKVKCSICGKFFITSHPNKKTCSIECSMRQEEKTFKAANKRTIMYNRKRK